MNFRKLFNRRNFKYGSFAVMLTAAVIAVVVVVNVIVSTLAQKYGWYFDMTSEGIYGLSDECAAILDRVDGGCDITVYFLTDRDMLSSGVKSTNYYGQSTMWGMKPIHEVALEISEKYPFVKVEYVNYAKDPQVLKEITGDSYDGITFQSTQILVDNHVSLKDGGGSVYDSYHSYRIFSRDAFYTFDYSSGVVKSFCGDYRLAAAISSVAIADESKPVAYFLTGHGETVGEYDMTDKAAAESDTDYSSAQSLWQLLRDCGYTIRKIDLRYEDFGDEEDALAIIFAPSTDLLAPENSDSFNETEKLEAFLSNKTRSLFVFANPNGRELTNLGGFLEKNCGVKLENKKIKDSGENSISVDGLTIVGTPSSDSDIIKQTENGYAAGLKAVFSSAQSIAIAEGTSKTVSLYDVPSSVSDKTYSGQSLMTYTTLDSGAHLLVCGSPKFVAGEAIDSAVYSNRETMLSAIDAVSEKASVPSGVSFKIIRNDGLDITSRQARIITVVLSAGVPLIFAVIGTIVYLRRRHS